MKLSRGLLQDDMNINLDKPARGHPLLCTRCTGTYGMPSVEHLLVFEHTWDIDKP